MTYYKSLNPASSGLNASYALHNILFFACIYLLSMEVFTHVDGCTCLLGDHTDFFVEKPAQSRQHICTSLSDNTCPNFSIMRE